MSEVVWAERGDDEAVAQRIVGALTTPGPKRLAFPGGRTPAAVLQRLAAHPAPWNGVELLPTDDRLVPADHPASNYGQLRRAFEDAAAEILPLTEDMEPPRFDLIWLGMGTDGHVASLFPGVSLDPAEPPRVIRVRPDPLPSEAPFERLSLNLAALVQSNAVILVVRGPEKRFVIEVAISGGSDLPVSHLLAAARPPVTIYWSPT